MIVAALFAFVFGVWFSFWFWWGPLVEKELELRGQWGDGFGAINALFSALAFAGLIVTVLLQREELKAQRAELRATRAEMKRSTEAQAGSHAALEAQREDLQMAALAQALLAMKDIEQISGKLSTQLWCKNAGRSLGYQPVGGEMAEVEKYADRFRATMLRFRAEAVARLMKFESP